ncbi:MAG: OmpA family protein [Candidatus Hydrogenedentes bacterium]|nr:OmpA family protein [Candidatus Hydrogenedentota bacterium]
MLQRILPGLAVALVVAAAVNAQDVDGSEDHPVISRYPGSVIQQYIVENYRAYKVPIGPVTGYRTIADWIETEGRLTRIYYGLDGGERSHSEVYKNYVEALKTAGFEMLAEGLYTESSRKPEVGSRAWQAVFFGANPWEPSGPIRNMVSGTATSGGSGTVIARKERAAGTVYVCVSVVHFSNEHIGTLVDVLEVEGAETGLIVVDAEAIGKGIEEYGRVVLDGILFDYDKATLQAESKAALEQIAIYLKANPDKPFYVVGHTDARGSLEYNQKLSSDRARAVVAALVKEYGIDAGRLEGHGVGPLAPVFTNESDAGREKNRRVELVER